MDADLTSSLLNGNVRNVELDAHYKDVAVVVRYELDGTASTDSENLKQVRGRRCQKIVRLRELGNDVDISTVAKHVIKCCPLITENRMAELEQILYYLQKRQKLGITGQPSENESFCSSSPSSSVSLDKIEDYIEMLYEKISDKVDGTAMILQLSDDIINIKNLVENETLVGALTRVLKDDWKKSYDLAINIVSIFYHFSLYSDFHPILVQHKIGTLCMQLIDYEMRYWNENVNSKYPSESAAKSYNDTLKKQQILITVCFNLLLNLAEDLKVELKMVNRNLLGMLVKFVADKKSSVELLLVVVNFLLKLSLFAENQQYMRDVRLVDTLATFFPIEDDLLRKSVFRLLFNLSFDIAACNQMVAAGLVSHVASFIGTDEYSMNLLYHLSVNDDAKATIAYTDVIQTLVRQLVDGTATDVGKGLLLNIALEKRNAQLICGSDGSGLDLLATTALGTNDHMLIKVLRNIAFHSGPSQMFFAKWAHRLLENVISFGDDDRNIGYSIDCLGTINTISGLNWDELVESYPLILWIQKAIAPSGKEPRFPPDFILQVVILCGTMARQLSVARLLVPFVNSFIDLLSAQQEDDEMVIQIVYFFYVLITHDELADTLITGSAQIGAYLLDLMHDRNLPIRTLCDAALSIIAERNEEWSRKMDVERFRWHNAQWMEMISDSNCTASCDTTLSASPDPFNIFGAEELLDEPEVMNCNE